MSITPSPDPHPFPLQSRVYSPYTSCWLTVTAGPDQDGWYRLRSDAGGMEMLNADRFLNAADAKRFWNEVDPETRA